MIVEFSCKNTKPSITVEYPSFRIILWADGTDKYDVSGRIEIYTHYNWLEQFVNAATEAMAEFKCKQIGR